MARAALLHRHRHERWAHRTFENATHTILGMDEFSELATIGRPPAPPPPFTPQIPSSSINSIRSLLGIVKHIIMTSHRPRDCASKNCHAPRRVPAPKHPTIAQTIAGDGRGEKKTRSHPPPTASTSEPRNNDETHRTASRDWPVGRTRWPRPRRWRSGVR